MTQPTTALVVGTRPQLIKAAFLQASHRARGGFDLRLIDTNQHYDDDLASESVTGLGDDRLRLTMHEPATASRIDRLVGALRPVLEATSADLVAVIGDTNSTTAATLVAAELGQRCVHIEAGLRSFDRRMPEERNRLIADHLCERLYAPSDVAMAHLGHEGLADRAILTGDLTYDLTLAHLATQPTPQSAGAAPLVLATIHRPANVDINTRFLEVANLLEQVARTGANVVFPAHPRVTERYDLRTLCPSIDIRPPMGHAELLQTIRSARLVVTDSGGVQRESFWLGRRCVTLRPETEWVETVELGFNNLAEPQDVGTVLAVLESCEQEPFTPPPVYGTGNAAQLILDDMAALLA
ncbi:MAG: UDP-N-acetyl glucosamine 2-epimerase [Actinomycetia bacterium]|nr:UDP-N-acetyl glucosamine 2-epimerase [Actinomycetes bacterium]